jgi:hypothetical protein
MTARGESCSSADFETLLHQPDLRVIGVVMVHPTRRETTTLWCDPDVDPRALQAQAQAAGQEPGAIVFVGSHGVVSVIRDAWKRERWVADYVAHLVEHLCDAGSLEAFFGQVLPVQD